MVRCYFMENNYSFKNVQATCKQLWETKNVYAPDLATSKPYSIDTPPPTVSGALHIGHIFSYTHTDIIARYKRMNGYQVFYPFGFDDNGLPTEKFVEKKEGIFAPTIGRSAFIERCLHATHETEEQFKKLWQTIGLSVDWQYWYSTISAQSRRLSQLSFIDLYHKGYVYRKNDPALYCPTCRTTIAQAELDTIEQPSFFNTIVFTAHDGSPLHIATTRPELLSSCVALFYHPDDSRYHHLKGTFATTPLFDITIPIIADDLVDPAKGTGLVMCCTFGDKTDIEWFKKHALPFKPSIGNDGKFLEHTGVCAGLKVAEARKKIVESLENAGLLIAKKSIVHAVSIHERCKKEIEFTVVPQWFIRILPYKKELLDLADLITWHPSFMKARYSNWVENLGWDWCISRQRFFGIPFPVWHCKSCGEILLAKENQVPLDPQETSYTDACHSCGSTNITPDTDVMDTWNTSSITPYICRELYKQSQDNPFALEKIDLIPMSMRPQAHDIIRTWAFYTLTKVWMHHKTSAWDTIVISGHVLAGSKEKISKSQGNATLTPEYLLENYPADVIRYWTASGSLGHDVAFSDQQLKLGQRLTTKLWNAFLFINMHTLDASLDLPENPGMINEWLLYHAAETSKQYQDAFTHNEFGTALHAIEKFFWTSFCDNYLELIKDQLFKPERYTKEEVIATKSTLLFIGYKLLQWFAPYMPYVTEHIYQEIYKKHLTKTSIHQTQCESLPSLSSKENVLTGDIIIELVSIVRKLKSEHQLSLKIPLKELVIACPSAMWPTLKKSETIIKGITQAEALIFQENYKGEHTLSEEASVWRAFVILKQ